MIPLTGPPRFAGITRDPSRDGWLECWWDDSISVWHEFDNGSMIEWERRVRLVGSATFEGASEQEALALASDLRGTFPVVPRTRAVGDPSWAEEVTVLCRRTSKLPATRPRCDFDAAGGPVWTVKIEIESVQVYADVPGVANGYYSEATVGGVRTLSAHDGATITRDEGQAVTLRDGSTVTIHTLTLGPAPTVARYAKREGSTILLQTRSDA